MKNKTISKKEVFVFGILAVFLMYVIFLGATLYSFKSDLAEVKLTAIEAGQYTRNFGTYSWQFDDEGYWGRVRMLGADTTVQKALDSIIAYLDVDLVTTPAIEQNVILEKTDKPLSGIVEFNGGHGE